VSTRTAEAHLGATARRDWWWVRGDDGALHLGLGLGTLVMLANVAFLTFFTFGATPFRTSSAGGSTASPAPPPRGHDTASGAA
jgi:hypothetical protein